MMEYTHELHKVSVREEIAHWITLEMGKTEADSMGDVWRGLEVVEAAGRVGSEMLVRILYYYCCCCYNDRFARYYVSIAALKLYCFVLIYICLRICSALIYRT